MAVNLGKNRLVLLTGYQDVIDETSDTDWALYTYEDDSNDLTLASSGGGGLAEIMLTFDNSRVMYGFCSLKEPNATLPRYILINWVGEDVPDARKCACASHVATIAEFFQGVEVTVNASSLDDIDPSAIAQRLVNGTAVVASPVLSRLRTREEENPDVGTVYEKTDAQVEMKKINREEFWEQAKREEEMRKEEEKKKAAEERQRYEEERMELERIEQENREKRYREREQQIEEHRHIKEQQSEAQKFTSCIPTKRTRPGKTLVDGKKLQEEEEAKERLRNQTTLVTEPSLEDLQLDKKESEVEEAKAIIAQRSDNPREFFKNKEKAMATSVDTSPVSIHRTGRVDSPFLRQQHSSSSPSPTPPHRGISPLRTPTHTRKQPVTAAAASTERNMAAVSPIPKIVTTAIKEDSSRDEEDYRDDWDSVPNEEQKPLFEESTPTKPVQSVAPQVRETSSSSVWESGTNNLVDLWDSSSQPPSDTAQTSKPSNLVDLMDEVTQDQAPPSAAATSTKPQSLLSFDEMMDGTFCSGPEDEPASLVDLAASDQMTLSYQHALQHASGEELDEGQLLMTNGETLLKEGTQASEGYFSQSQEEEFGQSEETSAKPAPIFYNKPPEIDITCWDTDPVVDDEDD
ncbi:drebrin isoform X1 [Takifugu flavidus]|uniref:drebrin isoform X1 n=1 Tax=Takifugu flavidus TaxID=433684 RepID=UPI0025449498|nr:drebrin isoform X1 [Takifugu flavidus]